MDTRRDKRIRPTALIVALSGWLTAGSVVAALSPTLTTGSAGGSSATGPASTPGHGLAMIELQLSLQRLAAPATERTVRAAAAATEPSPAAPVDASRLQALLSGLSRISPQESPSAVSMPRLSGSVHNDVSHAGAQAFMASVAADLVRAGGAPAAGVAIRPATRSGAPADVASLREAMQRFPLAGDTVASDTFSKVFLGLDDALPRLSGEAMAHARVDKAALRSRVVDQKLAQRTGDPLPQLDPVLVERTAEIALAEPVLPAGTTLDDGRLGGDQVAGLTDAPVGDLELRAAGPYRADDLPELSLDDTLLAMDELGGDTIAALESPVAADQLQETRAGFVLDNGVHIDFNVTRMTVVDGVEQLRTVINLPEGLDQTALAQISAGQTGSARVIQPGDTSSMFSVIQNEIDSVGVLDLTTVNVDIKNFGLRNVNFIRPALQADAIPPYLR